MAQQTIGLGTTANDGTGDTLRVAGDKINDNFSELYAADVALAASLADLNVLTWDFNFTGDAEAYVRSPAAMTITEQDTSGTGTVAYEISTAAAPDTFSSTTSPITLEAGAKLKVTASAVTGGFAVHLERTG